MIIRSKFESCPNDRKKLTISNSRSSIFRSNLKKPNMHEEQKKEPIVNYFINKSKQTDQKHQKNQFPSLGKENLHKKKSISLTKKQNYPEQKVKANSIIELLRGQRRQSNLPSIHAVEKSPHRRQSRNIRVENQQKFANNEMQIVNYQLSSVDKEQRHKPHCGSFEETHFFQYQKENVFPQINFMRQIMPTRKSYYSQVAENNSSQNELVSYSNQNGEMKKIQQFQKQKIQKSVNLTLRSLAFQIKICPQADKNNKISVQSQTIQEERQFFDYLRYKRKQNQLEEDLHQAFTLVDEIKQDRALYEERISKFLGFDRTKPSNDREERVFKLKEEILKLQHIVQSLISEKYKAFDECVEEFEKIEESFQAQNQKLLKSIQMYKQTYGAGLQPGDNQKAAHILSKVQKAIKNHFHQTQKKIYSQIQKAKTDNDQATELIGCFREYSKTIKEQKTLLKNCFGYIKKIPQLCYGLLGDELPNLMLKKENDVFEMPKCMRCFDSEWKLHMIIEKNQLMQSIFKVTEELFK